MMRPSGYAPRIVAAPLLVDGKPAGVMLLCNPHLTAEEDVFDGEADDAGEGAGDGAALLEVFVGFAAGVLRNLRKFQLIAKRND